MKTTEGGDPHHLSQPRPPPAQGHFRAAPALFRAATHWPPPAARVRRGALGRISRETLTCIQGGHAPLLEPLWNLISCGGRFWTPALPPPCVGVAGEARGVASRDPVGGREGPRSILRPDAAGKLGGQPGWGPVARSGKGACDLPEAGASCPGKAS